MKYSKPTKNNGRLESVEIYEGESIETKCARVLESGEPKETYITSQGFKMTLPTYYRNKIYTEEEKEKLWIEKLNKEERWVCGEKVSIKDNDYEGYNK